MNLSKASGGQIGGKTLLFPGIFLLVSRVGTVVGGPEVAGMSLAAEVEVHSFPGTFSMLCDGHGRSVGAVAMWSERRGNEAPFTPIEPLA
jgi:hypothetical protein